MRLLSLLIVAAFALAGCASLFAEPTTGHEARPAMDSVAASQLGDPIFLGMAGVEGSIDLERFNEIAKEELEEEGEDPAILDRFDLRYQSGALGDGRVGSWFGAYTDPEEDSFLLVQAGTTGTRSYLYEEDEEFEEDQTSAGGTLALPLLDQLPMRASSEAVEACREFSTHIPAGIDSDRAARVAMEQPTFRNHTQDVPDGDFIYVYSPAFESCEEGWESPAYWIVAHTDIDAWLDTWDDEDASEPTIAVVVMNATDGEVIEQEIVRSTTWESHHKRLTAQGDLLPPPLGPRAEGSVSFDVPADTLELILFAYPETGQGMEHWLEDPDGERVEAEEASQVYFYDIDEPAAGTWTFYGAFDHTPMEERTSTVEWHLIYYSDNGE